MAKSKKELDKDIMYGKLMPSAAKIIPAEPSASEPPPQQEPPVENELSQLKARLFNRSASPFSDDKMGVLVNLTENFVASRIDAAFSKFNCCKCDHCRKDVAAIALNHLPSKYIVMDALPEDAEWEKLSGDRLTAREVSAALVQAILQVRKSPRHK